MPTIDREFGENLLRCFEDFPNYGVHLLFNEWWAVAPQEAIDKYAAAIEGNEEQEALVREHYFAKPIALDTLAEYAPGTLGRAYHDFMTQNGLEANLATNYRAMHDMLAQSGKLDRMPAVIRYKVLRGFQTHDLQHVLTGYPATPTGEFALQAFGLAQLPFPYAGMWMATITTHMTLLDPDLIVPSMQAMSDGWQHGRRARNIQLLKWEEDLARPLEDIREEYLLDPAPTMPLAA